MPVRLTDSENDLPRGGLRGYRLFRIFGFEVKLNATWLLLGLLITWTLAAGLFPLDYPGLSRETYWWMGVAGALGVLFSIVFHELSHSLVARRYGLPIRGITLFIFGGVAEMEDEPVTPRVEFLMAIAGPLASLLLAIVFLQFELLATTLGWHTAVVGVSHYLGILNAVLAVFNLVPAFPLDGGRVLRAALWHWQQDLRRATRIASLIGAGFGVLLMVLGVVTFIGGNFIGGMWWFLIGAFLRGAARGAWMQLLVRQLLRDKPVREFMTTDPVTVAPQASVAELLEDYVYRHHHKLFPVVSDGTLHGCVSVGDIKRVPPGERARTTVGELASPCSSANTVAPDTDITRLLSAMARPDAGTRYMVVEDGRLLGVVSMKDLREYIALKLELESAPD